MNKKKWLNIYNSIIRLKFYAYLESERSNVLNEFDSQFQKFVDDFGINPKNEKVRFFGGQFLIGLSYLILVRTSEFIKNELSDTDAEIVLKIDNWKQFKVESFSDLVSRYRIKVNTLIDRKNNGKLIYSDDHQKLKFFITKLRNAVSHFNYENPDNYTIKLKDINPNSDRLEMECLFNYADFLNFCMDFGFIVNNCLGELYDRKQN